MKKTNLLFLGIAMLLMVTACFARAASISSNAVTGYWGATSTMVGDVVPGTEAAVTLVSGTKNNAYSCASTWGITDHTALNKNNIYFSDSITYNVTVGCVTGVWTGGTSSDWNTASNWCGGTIPTSSIAVTIPMNATYMPTLSSGETGNCSNLTFYSATSSLNFTGGNLIVAGNVNFSSGVITSTTSASTLSVGGTWTGAGTTFTPNTYLTVNFTGASQTIPQLVSNYYNLTLSGSGTDVLTTSTTTIAGNLSLSGTVAVTTVVGLSISGILNIGSGTTFTIATNNTTCASLIVSGTLTSLYYTMTVNGTVSGTGTINGNGGSGNGITFVLAGDWTFNGTVLNSVSLNFNGTVDQNWNGSYGFYNITINKSSGILYVAGNSTCSHNITITAGSVTYNYSGSQTVFNANYPANLTITGSGAKTMQANTTSINGNFILSGTASAITVHDLTVSGYLSIGDGAILTIGSSLSIAGTTTIGNGTSGILAISASNTITLTGAVTINSGGALTESGAAQLAFGADVTINGSLTEYGNATVSVAGNLTNNGSYNASTGYHTFSGTTHAANTIGGTNAITIPTTSNNTTINGTYTSSGTLNIPNIQVSGTLTNNGTLTISSVLNGGGSLIQGVNATLNIGSGSSTTVNVGTLTATNTGNTVNYTGASQQIKIVTVRLVLNFQMLITTDG